MALVNPNIAMSFRQPDIQVPNALAQYAQLQQIQGGQQAQELNKLQIQEYQRAREEEEGTRNFLRGRKLADPETQAGLAQFGKTGLGYAKLLQEQQAAALNAKNVQSQIDERAFGTQDKKLKFAWNAVGSAPTPQAAIAELTKGVKDGVFNMQSVTPDIQRLQNMTPDEYRQYRVEKVLGILDAKDKLGFMLPKTRDRDTGGVIQVIQDNPALPGYGQPIAGAAITKTPTIGETTAQQQLRVSQGQLSLAQQRLLFDQQKEQQPQFNAQAGGFIAPPTRENPQGVFIPAKDIQASKDQSAAVRALRSAGYDVETGEDTISKLIAKSTSGGLQAAGAGTLAFFGKSTEGRNAIAALEGTANQIATDLAGGKLGAGISNTDRDFIVGALGDVANPSKTSEERLAGWTAAKNRMMLTGLIPPPKGAGAPTAPVAPVKITGDADYNKLPSGSLFIGPDGQQRRKP